MSKGGEVSRNKNFLKKHKIDAIFVGTDIFEGVGSEEVKIAT